jgi:gas vesicle protein
MSEVDSMVLSKNKKFWLSRIGVMVAVIMGALAFLFYMPEPGMSNKGAGAKKEAGISASIERFYAEFKQVSNNPIQERFGEDTIALKTQNSLPLGNAIEQLSPNSYRPVDNWEGQYKERAFAAQSTLMQEARDHITNEGFNLVWDLKQDFIIRHRYQSNASLVGMLEEIADSVDSNFNRPIVVYYCANKRVFVITVRESDYINNNCQKSRGSFQSY